MQEIILPPTSHITRSKTVNETISLIADFRDFLVGGEVRVGQTVSVEVFTGDDLDPYNLLYQGITITNGAVLEQRFKEGIPGVIYSILFTLTTNTGNNYEWRTKLAVLPNTSTALPVFDVAYETTVLYPYIFSDTFLAGISINTGRLFPALTPGEYITAGLTINTGVLVYQQYYYTYPLDAFTAGIQINNGLLLYQNFITYSDGPENFKASIAILDGDLVAATQITYNIPADSISAGISISNGSLT